MPPCSIDLDGLQAELERTKSKFEQWVTTRVSDANDIRDSHVKSLEEQKGGVAPPHLPRLSAPLSHACTATGTLQRLDNQYMQLKATSDQVKQREWSRAAMAQIFRCPRTRAHAPLTCITAPQAWNARHQR